MHMSGERAECTEGAVTVGADKPPAVSRLTVSLELSRRRKTLSTTTLRDSLLKKGNGYFEYQEWEKNCV